MKTQRLYDPHTHPKQLPRRLTIRDRSIDVGEPID